MYRCKLLTAKPQLCWCNRTGRKIKQTTDSITHFTMKIWDKIMTICKLQTEKKVLNWVAYDSKFLPGQHDFWFNSWIEKDISALCIIQKGEKCMSFQELKGKFEPEKIFFFRYLHI